MLFEAPKDAGPAAYGAIDDLIERGASTLSEAMEMIRAIGKCAVDKLGDLDLQGIEATVGLKLSAKGKFVVAEASAEATLSVKFTIKSQSAR